MLHSNSCILNLNALALAANECAWDVVRGLARFGKSGKRAVPAGMVGVVACGTSFAGIALPTTRTMQNNLVGPRQPIFVHVKLDRARRRRCWTRDEAGFSGNLLQFGARVAPHGQQRQAVNFLEL